MNDGAVPGVVTRCVVRSSSQWAPWCLAAAFRASPRLLANFHPPFTGAGATVFAGKPAPTQIGGGHTSEVGHRPS
ncbi:hypothetical protein CIK02_06925 [Pseudomonas putida]|nr:hypothetical protein CIK02_06925 [Pseudomonas putida]